MDAMASEVSMAAAQDLRRRVAELERELGEAPQREAATAELLRVINRPQFALQSVFEWIALSAGRLCEAEFAFVLRYDGELLSFGASYGLTPEAEAAWQKELPRPAGEDTAIGRAILSRAVVQIPDVQGDPAYGAPALAQMVTYKSLMAVPFLCDGRPIGGITVGRAHTGPFPEGQIGLLRNFADQAVIAIENTRLLEKVQARTKELQESLEYQTAIGDVLGVISRSPSNVQPVLDLIAETAMRLCQSDRASKWRLEDRGHRLVAMAPANEILKRRLSETIIPVDRASVSGRVALDGCAVHVHDAWEDPVNLAVPELVRDTRRTILGVPLFSKGVVAGVIILPRSRVEPFTKRQIALVETFAEQAVIAIENARLFEAEQVSKRELQ
jgi:GAF domain-containing protein